MDKSKQSNTAILEDLQPYGVGPEWNASGENQRAALLALQGSPVLASDSAFEDKGDATPRFSTESSPARLDRLDRSVPESLQSRKGLSVRFIDSDDHYSQQASGVLRTPDEMLSLQFVTRPEEGSGSSLPSPLQSQKVFLSATQNSPPPENAFPSDLATAEGYPRERSGTIMSTDIKNDCNEKASLLAPHTKNEGLSFPLDIRIELDHKKSPKEDFLQKNSETATHNGIPDSSSQFYSAPLPFESRMQHPSARKLVSGGLPAARNWNRTRSNGEEYEMFRTKSGRRSSQFQRSLSQMQSRMQGKEAVQTPEKPRRLSQSSSPSLQRSLPARRYFAALQGPELENLKDSEEILLPLDKQWPFLLRFPISSFGISLGLGSQTILWKSVAVTSSVHLLHVPKLVNLILWCLTLFALITIFSVYLLKLVFYFEAVHREFHHPVRVNFFFAPWIAAMFLTIGVPPAIATSIHPSVWCIFMTPIFLLELKIYGQWLSGGERRLSRVANPSTHLSVVGNFVGAILGAIVGWKEAATFFWSVGLAHYFVLFVTLYQRLPTNETLPKELHPVFFLFVAAPSSASVAWEKIVGDFDHVSQIVYFISIFLFASLVVRLNFFRGFKFSISWWAYTFPMTAASIATIRYSQKVSTHITQVMAVALTVISSTTVLCLFISTILHFWSGNLYPNDMAIAITARKHMVLRKRHKKGGCVSSQDGILPKENNKVVMGEIIPKLLQQCTSFPGSDGEMVNGINLEDSTKCKVGDS